MIKTVIKNWHSALQGELDFGELLHPDCTFWSPVVFKPLEGREITKMYLSAAYQVFPGDDGGEKQDNDAGSFKYTQNTFLMGTMQFLNLRLLSMEFQSMASTSLPVTTKA